MNPFDIKSAFLARHAQHVVIIHFPIALFITSVAFDLLALWRKSSTLSSAAYYNLVAAAVSALPAVATGLLAWQLQGSKETFGCIWCWRYSPVPRSGWCGGFSFAPGENRSLAGARAPWPWNSRRSP
jgi:hypothetical protein